jgi:hypothetical protein
MERELRSWNALERTGTPYCALLKSTVSCLLLLMLVVIGNTEGAFAPLFRLPHPHRQEQRRGQLLPAG